ncbi:hypothetical protein FYK20_24185 [Escherichia albertii]|nr:hypothetical protein FYK20_24185 [Escherichia albertii]
MWLQFTGIVFINFQFAASLFCGIAFYHRHGSVLLWCCQGSVEYGRAGRLECDKDYTSPKVVLKFSALSKAGASWRLHGGA